MGYAASLLYATLSGLWGVRVQAVFVFILIDLIAVINFPGESLRNYKNVCVCRSRRTRRLIVIALQKIFITGIKVKCS